MGGLLHTGLMCFFFSSRRRHTRCYRDWSSDVCSSDLKFVTWVRTVMASRRQESDARATAIVDGIRRAIAEVVASGTAVVGDIRSEERRVGKESRAWWG